MLHVANCYNISIHAPTRGATSSGVAKQIVDVKISIHAPTRGATPVSILCCWSPLFQSTLPREERLLIPVRILTKKDISIHAPTRGATIHSCVIGCNDGYFNPRSHERSDDPRILAEVLSIYFNPRSHERSDVVASSTIVQVLSISIHAPTRGATNWRVMYPITIEFQSTLPREERPALVVLRELFI